ncbi:MAG TPA: T9SS type A sorting domain-containing protein [Saprospiraceae bacterium]|nr:T9SS type A sorting domain-containing protein [Saprospiraceae bacterium]
MKNLFLSLLFLGSLLAHPIAAQNAQWRHLGDTLLSSWNTTTVLTALNGQTPHLAIQGYDNLGNAHWSIQRWNGSGWVKMDTAGLGQMSYSALGFTNAGTPQLAYFDGVSGKFGIKRLLNGLWSTLSESPVITTTGLYPISMVFENNRLWVGFTHPDQNNRAFVWHFDGNSWLQLGQGGISVGNVYPLMLQVDNGTPWIAYREIQQEYAGVVKKFDGANWQTIGGSAFDSNVHGNMDFAVKNGKPYLIHSDSSTDFQANVISFDGTNWQQVGNPLITSAYSYLKLAIDDQTNQPFFLFEDAGPNFWGLSAMRFNGTSWEFVGNRGFIPNYWSVTLIIRQGTPYVGYQWGPFGGPASFQVFSQTSSTQNLPDHAPFFSIQPNPVTQNHLMLHMELEQPEQFSVALLDMNGKNLSNQSVFVSAGKSQTMLELPSLPSGAYVLQLQAKSGAMGASRICLIQR